MKRLGGNSTFALTFFQLGFGGYHRLRFFFLHENQFFSFLESLYSVVKRNWKEKATVSKSISWRAE